MGLYYDGPGELTITNLAKEPSEFNEKVKIPHWVLAIHGQPNGDIATAVRAENLETVTFSERLKFQFDIRRAGFVSAYKASGADKNATLLTLAKEPGTDCLF